MAYEVKIITFINDREGREDGEEILTRLVNDGWEIKTSGGGTGADMVWGFVILQRERRDAAENLQRLELGSDPGA
jgi:hypothetical protein